MITAIGKERFFEEKKGKLVFHAWFTINPSLGAAFGEQYGEVKRIENRGSEGILPFCSEEYLKLLSKNQYASHESISQICDCGRHWAIFTPKTRNEPFATLEIYEIAK